ncbi:hypothetical protein [Bacillus sp. SM2101]|nr:hypothetical protein [Bacillus sp. SM2101]
MCSIILFENHSGAENLQMKEDQLNTMDALASVYEDVLALGGGG